MCHSPSIHVINMFSEPPKFFYIQPTPAIDTLIKQVGIIALGRLSCATKHDIVIVRDQSIGQNMHISLEVQSNIPYDPNCLPNPQREIRLGINGLFIVNKRLILSPNYRGAGIARLAVALQIRTASQCGFSKIMVDASGDAYYCGRTHDLTGFKYWPSLGFDDDIPYTFLSRINNTRDLSFIKGLSSQTIQCLLASNHGRMLWNSHGLGSIMKVELKPTNPAINWVGPYLRRTGL